MDSLCLRVHALACVGWGEPGVERAQWLADKWPLAGISSAVVVAKAGAPLLTEGVHDHHLLFIHKSIIVVGEQFRSWLKSI